MLPAAKKKKDVLPANQRSMVIYEYVCHCNSRYVYRTTQRLQERIKQHVPKAIRQKTTLTQEQGTHRSQPTRTQPNRKCKAKSKTQFEPESDFAIGQDLLESNQCARNYSDSQFKILTTARSQFHLVCWKRFIFHGKKQICAGKSSTYSLYNCFGKIKACWHWIDCVSPYYLAIPLKRISPYCIVHFSLLQNAFLLTAQCISPYCIWSLKDPARSPHTKPDRDRK